MAQFINSLCVWLDQTALSQAIQAIGWIVPTVQMVHILSVAVVITSAPMLDLRLIGVVGVDQPLDHVWARVLPFVWWPLQWAPGADRDADTYASPDVWGKFADFYQRAAAASQLAFEASRTKRADDFKARIVELRAACNSCHAAYQKVD
jgi:hypothetical protein